MDSKKLPTKVEVSLVDCLDDSTLDEIFDYIGDYLSNKYGYCHYDFEASIVAKVDNIDWDTTE